MPYIPFSRRQLFLLSGFLTRVVAFGDDFWNSKAPSEWGPGDIYQLMNHSPWANPVRWDLPIEALLVGIPGRPRGVVTWESAQPIRDALKTPPAPVYENYYVIGLDGLPPGTYSADYLSEFALLRSTGTSKWRVKATGARERIRTSSVYQFAFSRTAAPISAGTEEVIFEMALGQWTLETKFRPKNMMYHGRLAV